MKKLILAFGIFCSGTVFAGEPITMQRPVPYAENSAVASKIQKECKVPEQLADFLKKAAQDKGMMLNFTDSAVDTSKGRVLKLEILDAMSMGNAFMGHAKSTIVRGEFFENGESVGSFMARRNSMGGMWGGYKSSCSVLARTAKTLSSDIAAWLEKPTKDAKLGDL
ncbi:MAG: hypothetical protein ACREO1_05405 [Arenimonas sp.]